MKDLLDMFYIQGGHHDIILYAITIDPKQPIRMSLSDAGELAAAKQPSWFSKRSAKTRQPLNEIRAIAPAVQCESSGGPPICCKPNAPEGRPTSAAQGEVRRTKPWESTAKQIAAP